MNLFWEGPILVYAKKKKKKESAFRPLVCLTREREGTALSYEEVCAWVDWQPSKQRRQKSGGEKKTKSN
jgi:hypothetical protein